MRFENGYALQQISTDFATTSNDQLLSRISRDNFKRYLDENVNLSKSQNMIFSSFKKFCYRYREKSSEFSLLRRTGKRKGMK